MGSILDTFVRKLVHFSTGTGNVVAMGSLIEAFVRKLVYIRMGTKTSLLWEAFVRLAWASRF